jgi:hypothetical protein
MVEPDGTPAANWQLVIQINAKTFSLASPVPSRGSVTFTAPLGPQNVPFPLARPFIGVEYGGWLNIFGLKFPFPALPTDVNTLVTKADLSDGGDIPSRKPVICANSSDALL